MEIEGLHRKQIFSWVFLLKTNALALHTIHAIKAKR